MLNFFRLPSVLQSLGESRGQMQTLIGSSQQNRSAIGTALSLIELRHYGTLRNSREENTLCRVMLAQAKASFWSQTRLRQRLCTMKRLFVSLRTCIIRVSSRWRAVKSPSIAARRRCSHQVHKHLLEFWKVQVDLGINQPHASIGL